jgi:hypothetical protein
LCIHTTSPPPPLLLMGHSPPASNHQHHAYLLPCRRLPCLPAGLTCCPAWTWCREWSCPWPPRCWAPRPHASSAPVARAGAGRRRSRGLLAGQSVGVGGSSCMHAPGPAERAGPANRADNQHAAHRQHSTAQQQHSRPHPSRPPPGGWARPRRRPCAAGAWPARPRRRPCCSAASRRSRRRAPPPRRARAGSRPRRRRPPGSASWWRRLQGAVQVVVGGDG